MKETTIKMFGDTFTEYNVLVINYLEMNMKFITEREQKSIYNLFTYLVNKGYNDAAQDLWDGIIKAKFIVNSR